MLHRKLTLRVVTTVVTTRAPTQVASTNKTCVFSSLLELTMLVLIYELMMNRGFFSGYYQLNYALIKRLHIDKAKITVGATATTATVSQTSRAEKPNQ